MKKLLTVICSLCLSVLLFALSACGGSGVSGEIKGDYKAADETNYAAMTRTLSSAKTAREDAKTAGGSLNSEFELALTFDGKTVSVSGNEALSLKVDLEKGGVTAALESELKLKMDDKFIDKIYETVAATMSQIQADIELQDEAGEDTEDAIQIPDIGKVDVTINANAYVSEQNLYLDAKVKGLSDKIKALAKENGGEQAESTIKSLEDGIKYAIPAEMMQMLIGGAMGNLPLPIGGDFNVEEIKEMASGVVSMISAMPVDSVNTTLEGLGLQLLLDVSDSGVKIKLATLATAKDTLLPMILNMAKIDASALTDLTAKTLDLAIYIAFDADGILTGAALNANIDLSAKAFGKDVRLTAKGAADLVIEVPEIKLPDFAGYVNPLGPVIVD